MNPQTLKIIIFILVTLGELLQLVAICLIQIAQAIVTAYPHIEIQVPHIDLENCRLDWITLNPVTPEHTMEPSPADSNQTQPPTSPNTPLSPGVSPRL